eukprot:141912-Chlamydomonas_euryale.AAC.7
MHKLCPALPSRKFLAWQQQKQKECRSGRRWPGAHFRWAHTCAGHSDPSSVCANKTRQLTTGPPAGLAVTKRCRLDETRVLL